MSKRKIKKMNVLSAEENLRIVELYEGEGWQGTHHRTVRYLAKKFNVSWTHVRCLVDRHHPDTMHLPPSTRPRKKTHFNGRRITKNVVTRRDEDGVANFTVTQPNGCKFEALVCVKHADMFRNDYMRDAHGYVEVIDNNGHRCRLHRLIMGHPRGYEVDHVNGDRRDNRECNLNVVTHDENQRRMRERHRQLNLQKMSLTGDKNQSAA